jgi:transcription initiation factor TFIID subunit 11
MEHFLNNTDDHNSSFFQPPRQDDETDVITDQHSPSDSNMETTTNPKPEESMNLLDRVRPNLNIDEEANIKLQVLVSNFSDEQLDRYEMYRRSAFSKVAIKRLMHSITGTIPSSNVVIAMAGIAKVFVGEIVEEALEVQRRENKNNENKPTPLEPKHLREAYRRLNNQYHCPQRKTWKSKRKSRF